MVKVMALSSIKRLDRRRRILSSVRDYLSKYGYEKASMKDLADHCEVSIQTLYNNFESRDGLILASADDVYRFNVNKIEFANDLHGVEMIFFIVDSIGRDALEAPKLYGALLYAVKLSKNGWRSTLADSHRLYSEAIRGIKEQGELIEFMDPDFLAGRLMTRLINVVEDWIAGNTSNNQLQALRNVEVCLLLLGVVSGSAQQAVLTKLQEAYSQLHI